MRVALAALAALAVLATGPAPARAQSDTPRLRVATLVNREHQEMARAARSHAEELLDETGNLRPGQDALARELASGWLKGIHAGDAAETATAA